MSGILSTLLASGGAAAAAPMAFDAAAGTEMSNSAGPLTWTHTPVGTPSAVVVGVANYQGASSVSSVTYGATTLTLLTSEINSTAGVFLYGANNVAAGPQTVTVTVSASGSYTAGSSITVTGSSLSTAFETPGVATDFSSVPAATATSQTGEIVVDVISTTGAPGFTPDVTQTQRSSAGVIAAASSTKPSSASSTTMNWTLSFASLWVMASVAFHK